MAVLLHSKAFWTALLAVITTLVLTFLHVPAEIWAPIDALFVVVIGIFTGEAVSNQVIAGIRAMRGEK